MQDRFKFRYVFTKDFGGKTGICYKMPIFNLDTITDEKFNKIVKSYIDYNYKLISIEQSTGLKDKNGKLIYEGDIVRDLVIPEYIYQVEWFKGEFKLKSTISNLFLNFDTTQQEVIGNIFQDKELMNEA